MATKEETDILQVSTCKYICIAACIVYSHWWDGWLSCMGVTVLVTLDVDDTGLAVAMVTISTPIKLV